jgi:cell wall assembly regulator SMI1
LHRVATSWKLIEEVLAEHARTTFKALRPPASERRLAGLARSLPVKLPNSFVQSLRVHDGMRNSLLGPVRLVNNFALLTASEVLTVWRMEWELQQECEFGGCPSTDTAEIKNDSRWRAGWVPVMDSEGDHLVLDLDPGPKGVIGQLFLWSNYGHSPMRVVGKSWREWLHALAVELTGRQFTLDTWGGIDLHTESLL